MKREWTINCYKATWFKEYRHRYLDECPIGIWLMKHQVKFTTGHHPNKIFDQFIFECNNDISVAFQLTWDDIIVGYKIV